MCALVFVISAITANGCTHISSIFNDKKQINKQKWKYGNFWTTGNRRGSYTAMQGNTQRLCACWLIAQVSGRVQVASQSERILYDAPELSEIPRSIYSGRGQRLHNDAWQFLNRIPSVVYCSQRVQEVCFHRNGKIVHRSQTTRNPGISPNGENTSESVCYRSLFA